MSTVKEEIRKMLDQLPDDVSFEAVQYHIYVRQKLEQGLKDLEEGSILKPEGDGAADGPMARRVV